MEKAREIKVKADEEFAIEKVCIDPALAQYAAAYDGLDMAWLPDNNCIGQACEARAASH